MDSFQIYLVTFFFFFLVWLGLLGWDSWIFLVTFLFFLLFLFIYYTTRRIVVKSDKKKKASLVWFLEWKVKNFSSLFCFCFFWRNWVSPDKTAKYIILYYIVLLFYFSLYLLYYARDSCKKWQEKKDKLGLTSENEVNIFLVTILFYFFFLSWRYWVCSDFFFWCDWVCSDKTAEYFSSLFCFISFFYTLYLLYYAQDSCKKWQEKNDRLGPISSLTVRIFLVTILFFLFLAFWQNVQRFYQGYLTERT